jgi:hypothetical protein
MVDPVSLVSSWTSSALAWANCPLARSSAATVQRLLASNLLDQRCHRHTLGGKTDSHLMHGGEKLASRIVDTGDLPHVDFNFVSGARRRAPHIFRFGNPGTPKFASELQATLAAVLMNCDS